MLVGFRFLTAQNLVCYMYLWHVCLPYQTVYLTCMVGTAQVIYFQHLVNVSAQADMSREERQRTVWEDNSPWIAPVSACHGSQALTTLCSRLFEDVCTPNFGRYSISLSSKVQGCLLSNIIMSPFGGKGILPIIQDLGWVP